MFEYRPVPKQIKHARKQPKRAHRTAFSAKTIDTIRERDNGLCVRCGKRGEEIHHVIYRSQGGSGEVSNGVLVCRKCHEFGHSSREGRIWFEKYRETHLI